jgi:hypothetical protein
LLLDFLSRVPPACRNAGAGRCLKQRIHGGGWSKDCPQLRVTKQLRHRAKVFAHVTQQQRPTTVKGDDSGELRLHLSGAWLASSRGCPEAVEGDRAAKTIAAEQSEGDAVLDWTAPQKALEDSAVSWS